MEVTDNWVPNANPRKEEGHGDYKKPDESVKQTFVRIRNISNSLYANAGTEVVQFFFEQPYHCDLKRF